MADFSIIPTQQDVDAYFTRRPEALLELHHLTLIRMYRELLDQVNGGQGERERQEDG